MTFVSNPASQPMSQSALTQNLAALGTTLERLSTGQRINRGADGPADLIIGNTLSAALASLEAETRVLERNSYAADYADAAFAEASGMLADAEAAAVAMANSAGMTDAERDALQMQIDSSVRSAERIFNTAEFNGQRVFDGDFSVSAMGDTFTVAAINTGSIGRAIDANGNDVTLRNVVSGQLDPATAQASIRAATSDLNTSRSELAAFQANTIGAAFDTARTAFANVAAARSDVIDLDFAQGTAALARDMVLSGSATTVLSIAGGQSRAALRLVT